MVGREEEGQRFVERIVYQEKTGLRGSLVEAFEVQMSVELEQKELAGRAVLEPVAFAG